MNSGIYFKNIKEKLLGKLSKNDNVLIIVYLYSFILKFP